MSMIHAAKNGTRLDAVTRRVVLTGLADLMFDRHGQGNEGKLDWYQKVYLIPGTNVLCLPTTNIVSFLSSQNTNSAPKRLRDAGESRRIGNACLSFVTIEADGGNPNYIPITRNGKPIEVGKFGDEHDPQSGLYLDKRAARFAKGEPNPKERPVLPLDWELAFSLTIYPNREIKEREVRDLFEEGGIAVGLGAFRGMFGKFQVSEWA